MKKDILLHTIDKLIVRLKGTTSNLQALRAMLLLLVMLTFSTGTAWGQTGTDYSGVYYFINCGSGKNEPTNWIDNDKKIENITNPDDYFYLVPADNPQQSNKCDAWFSSNYSTTNGDPEMPYLTTYKTKKDEAEVPEGVTNRPHNSVWIVKFASTDNGTDYYNLIHAATGKYVVYEPPYSAKNNRKSVHLLTTDSPGENAKFAITTTTPTNTYPARSGYYNFRVKSITSGNRFLNPTNANYNFYYSKDGKADGAANYFRGLVGIYLNKNNDNKDDASASDWKPEKTLLPAPTISYVSETNTFTISYEKIPAGFDILYTIDETEPTIGGATTSTYDDSPVLLTGSSKTVKAVVARYGLVLTEVAILEPCAKPVITYDYTTSNVSITCATPNNTIYYTTDGSVPTTSSTEYSAPFSATSATTVKAIATHASLPSSAVAELEIQQVATPTIQNNGSNAISITTTTPSATIYYTTDGTDPTTTSTEYTGPLTENVSNVTIKAIAVKENMITSEVGSGKVKLQCATPVITRDGLTFTLSCSFPTDASFYYSLDGGTPGTLYNGPVSFTSEELPMTVKAVARHDDYTDSEVASMLLKNGSGTAADPYMIYGATDFANFIANVNAGSTSAAYYKLGTDVSGSSASAITTAFTGTFDGGLHTISGLDHALFNTVSGGVVKNVILDNVTISGGTNAGAICNEAIGASRIYNCGVLATSSTVEKDEDGYDHISSSSSSIKGSGYVGSIVGLLDGSSRVINCFSYADVSGGTHVGGIVGYNSVATTASNLQTMVMNCMFYGEVSGGSIAPIYNGEIITNDGDADGVNNFNYFRLESSYIQNTDIPKVYNCALGAETRFLQRFEFFRYLLNSNRELAAWWATGDANNKDKMMKWVMEPTQIGTTTPYPILKTPDKYASVVNYTPSETAYDEANRNKGRKLTSEGDGGVLHVTIQMDTNTGSTPYSQPNGAGLKSGVTGSFDLTITDKDYEHYNFNYAKVQLPYYNDYCDGNYTGNRVVTGWKIVSITGGTAGSYSTGASDVTYDENGNLTATPYNFANRKCTNKDLYGTNGSNRVFNQGAYWNVPEGVTAITIEPYWGKAVYLADAYWDVVYQNGTGDGTAAGTAYDAMTTDANVPNVGGGQHYENGVSTFNSQVVFTSIGDAISSSNNNGLFKGVTGTPKNQTVYDYAVVLVGNYHRNYRGTNDNPNPEASDTKPYTVTSVDLDSDNEPDYSFMMRFNGRQGFHPVRYDFLNLIGLGMAQKTTGGKGSYNLGIMQPKYWFEVTNTALFRVTQFEYSPSNRTKKPIILQGGVIEQWVTQQDNAGDRVEYFHVGGNVWFKEFHRGSHQDNADKSTPHPPVSVTGGDYDKFYLTGYYQSKAAIYDDNAECYINGGRFGEVAGAGMEGIGSSDGKGNVTWVIDHADIEEFYGGGINYAKPVHGNIHTIISNSHVNLFCGGPKFGDMESGHTVTTTATNCTFGTYFGAGYGGNSYNRIAPRNHNNIINFPHNDKQAGNHASWNVWLAAYYKQDYGNGGVSTQFDYQFLPMSSNTENVARIFVEYVGFSLATCRNVTSSLTGCTVTGNFYGGGSLGKVAGDVTSTLTDCTVNGSAFGAGYSASIPTVEVMDIGFATEPYYYEDLGTYRTGVFPTTTTYTWEHRDQVTNTATAINKTDHILYTTEDLTQLGTVIGKVTLTIDGTTTVGESVFGGGESSNVGDEDSDDESSTTVNVIGGTVTHDVYGGGALANVVGNTKVNLIGGTVSRDVYGGGMGRLEVVGKEAVGTEGEDGYEPAVEAVTPVAATVDSATVNLNGMDAADYIAAYTTLTREGDSGPYTVADDKKGCIIGGSIFGCNNLNGTPLGTVTVHVYKTQNAAATRIANPATGEQTAKVKGRYDVQHVYGGGNLAAYEPTNALLDYTVTNNKPKVDAAHTTVIIDGCDRTSIYQVYGGGNAASTPATEVTVNGTYEIGELFGGGNGKDDIVINGVQESNPGANVGYGDYSAYENSDDADHGAATAELREANYSYGSGKAQVNIHGGTIHYVYGGSNTKGNVREIAVAMLEELQDDNETAICDFVVDEAYGGGKSAPMDGEAKLEMKCIPGLNAAYGGAENADINNSVTLNITNGLFGQVFGGNNRGGRIMGSITVNIEETGCRPIIIGELYGGGNRAAYSVYGYKPETDSDEEVVIDDYGKMKWLPLEGGVAAVTIDGVEYAPLTEDTKYRSPVVNVKSFTSIGNIFGGGYGETAVMVGDPTVNINVAVGDKTEHADAKIETEGTIEITEELTQGNTTTRTVKYPTHEQGKIGAINYVFGGGNAAKVIGNTTVNIGTEATVDYVTLRKVKNEDGTIVDETTPRTGLTVKGADIRHNVFGGGNTAEVKGNAVVTIGKSTTP